MTKVKVKVSSRNFGWKDVDATLLGFVKDAKDTTLAIIAVGEDIHEFPLRQIRIPIEEKSNEQK